MVTSTVIYEREDGAADSFVIDNPGLYNLQIFADTWDAGCSVALESSLIDDVDGFQPCIDPVLGTAISVTGDNSKVHTTYGGIYYRIVVTSLGTTTGLRIIQTKAAKG